jgi:general L-amino acid transport system permease protein
MTVIDQSRSSLRLRSIHRGLPMFHDPFNAVATFLVGGVAAYLAYLFLDWAVARAVWTVDDESANACRASSGTGACWAVVSERLRFMLFGTYPYAEQWRPAVGCVLFIMLYLLSAIKQLWRSRLLVLWLVLPACGIAIMVGGVGGLDYVPTEFWGGLPLTFILSTVGFSLAFPLAILLALGRRSSMPAIRTLCVVYIELIRGVPFITFLFMAAVMFPLFVPQGFTVDKLLRAQVALVLVIAAYLAEVIRAGLQAIPKGQYEAAHSLGLSFWATTRHIALPQGLRVTIPALVNTFIAFFKDTSLVAIIGLFDLLGAAKAVLVDPKWVGFGVEVYVFVSLIYFVFCFAVSRFSQNLERELATRSHR